MTELVGSIIMSVDGDDVDVVSVSPTRNTGRKPVKTMNRTGRTTGFAKGVSDIMIKVTAVVDPTKPRNWDAIEGAKISIENQDGSFRESYLGCGTVSVGEQYTVDNEARIDIDMYSLDHVVE